MTELTTQIESANYDALSGLKVLDLTHWISGPYCTKLLSELGAEVLKIERPDIGDGARRVGPFPQDEPDIEKSGLFLYLNTGKKSITLDLKSQLGKQIFLRLVKWADVLVENFEPRVMPDLGLDYEHLEQVNPRLVIASISNFGQTGPYRDYKATEIVLFALTGMMYQLGPYHCPVSYPLYQTQLMAGSHASAAIIASIFSRERNKTAGEHVDISVAESLMSMVAYFGCYYTYMGAIRGRWPQVPSLVDTVLPAKDGHIAPVFYGYVDWQDFCNMLSCPELDRPEFADFEGRSTHMKELEEILTREFARWGKAELVTLAQEWRFPFAMVQTTQDLVSCPQLEHRQFFVELDHPVAGRLTYPGIPFRMSESAMKITGGAPLLGEHNEEVYCNILGYSKADLIEMWSAPQKGVQF